MSFLLFLFAFSLPVVLLDEGVEEEVVDPVTDISPLNEPLPDSYISGLKSYLRWSPDNLHAHHEPGDQHTATAPEQNQSYQEQFQQQETVQERSLSLQPGIGWAVGTAIIIFAFANTVLVGSTMVVTYTIYQILLSVLAVLAPSTASVFASLLGPLG